jgi:hypothetical protein
VRNLYLEVSLLAAVAQKVITAPRALHCHCTT